MGRKSSLSDAKWAELGKRLLAPGSKESARSLAKEFGTSEASVRRKFPAQRKDVKDVANQILAAEQALAGLPVSSQIDAVNLAHELRAISIHLAGAAKFGAATAHRLSGIANAKVQEIDDAAPLDEASLQSLKGVAVLTKVANEASQIGVNLLSANREMVKKGMEEEPPTPVRIIVQVEDASVPES
jgi:hypothetical protein